ncbi:MAG: hypothetical protein QF775_02345 [archaeon]|jgi:hypothetical protein|nr:hypothetical protein [Euryarchaeota archaeon]MDP6704301.1 hypothetical protein [archaeon]|tara:strand:- start:36442 stop:36822 length:381 start_codon:yes stop_codon:yes gene_type:complete
MKNTKGISLSIGVVITIVMLVVAFGIVMKILITGKEAPQSQIEETVGQTGRAVESIGISEKIRSFETECVADNGDPTCTNIGNRALCEDLGCTWSNFKCTGGTVTCGDLDSANCIKVSGCSWQRVE